MTAIARQFVYVAIGVLAIYGGIEACMRLYARVEQPPYVRAFSEFTAIDLYDKANDDVPRCRIYVDSIDRAAIDFGGGIQAHPASLTYAHATVPISGFKAVGLGDIKIGRTLIHVTSNEIRINDKVAQARELTVSGGGGFRIGEISTAR